MSCPDPDDYCFHCGKWFCDCELDPPESDGFDEEADELQESWEKVRV